MRATQVTRLISVIAAMMSMTGCVKNVQAPSEYADVEVGVKIMPDYTNVVIPPNIAPLNFEVVDEEVSDCVARLTCGETVVTCGRGRIVEIDMEEWKRLVAQAVGKEINVELFTRKEGVWRKHPSYTMTVVKDSIDRYVTYRVLPSLDMYEHMAIWQRDLEGYETREVYNNYMIDNQPDGSQCINCHSFQSHRTEKMQLHVRGTNGGTMIYHNGKLEKYNVKDPAAISGAVYAQWHPKLDIIAYSLNTMYLMPHTRSTSKCEVIDSQSGMALYDVGNRKLYAIENEKEDAMPTFPTWSPDGEYLYYCQANFAIDGKEKYTSAEQRIKLCVYETSERYESMRYDIYRRKFDLTTYSLGEPEKVLDASSDSMSASMPRISPDGRYMITSIGRYGNFHIYHEESDLYLTDLSTDNFDTRPLEGANSDRAESYHNYSSNGRWIVLQSRRRDNNYTTLYFSYFDADGNAHKAFEMPQQDPTYESTNLCSYNLPEFTVEPVRTDIMDMYDAVVKQEAQRPVNVDTDGATTATVLRGRGVKL